MQSRLKRNAVVAAAFGFLALGSSDFTEAAVECEHTVVHLLHCCPDLDVNGVCNDTTGCDSYVDPIFSVAESKALQDQSCERIQANFGCEDLNRRMGEHSGY